MFWSQCDYLSKAKKHFCGKGRQRKVMMDAAVYKCILQPASGKVQENMLSSYIFLNWIYFIKYTSCIYIVVFCQKPTVQEGKNSMKLQCCVVFNTEGSSIFGRAYTCVVLQLQCAGCYRSWILWLIWGTDLCWRHMRVFHAVTIIFTSDYIL